MAGLLSLVIPVFNEADSLEPLVAEIDASLGPPASRSRSSSSTTAPATARSR